MDRKREKEKERKIDKTNRQKTRIHGNLKYAKYECRYKNKTHDLRLYFIAVFVVF